MYYARGSYASYKGPGVSSVKHLLYPCPDTGKSSSINFQSLGTHLTIDMASKLRFGPDLDWIAPPSTKSGVNREEEEVSYEEDDVDYWQRHLVPDETRLREMHKAVTGYLPEVTFEGLQPDYCGIRPKLVGPGGGFQDFVIRVNRPEDFMKGSINKGEREGAKEGKMINLLGIESPGLTSSLAIAELVVDDMLGGTEGGER